MSDKLASPWVIEQTDPQYNVTIYVTDTIDKRGRYLPDGAYKVEHDGKKLKTFKGESAQFDAYRLAYDTITNIQYGATK